MLERTCIVCPRGCRLRIELLDDGSYDISGNACSRGPEWARAEMLDSRRIVTTTLPVLADPACPETVKRLPVKTSAACPRHLIDELLSDIYSLQIDASTALGDILIKNWRNLGFDVIASRDARVSVFRPSTGDRSP